MYKKYSTASDVWSFGALMYEIWSLGHKPFEGRTNQEVSESAVDLIMSSITACLVFVKTINDIENGVRLSSPPGCPQEIYRLMIQCWSV